MRWKSRSIACYNSYVYELAVMVTGNDFMIGGMLLLLKLR